MLVTLLSWIIISFTCWSWGIFLFRSIGKWSREKVEPGHSFALTCIGGLIAVSMITSLASLFLPMKSPAVQAFLLLPAACGWIFSDLRRIMKEQLTALRSLHYASATLLLSGLILVLLMSSWEISHPDTLAYHAPIIKWIEEFKAVPGLVHLHARYGLQNAWFVLCAAFSFKSAGTDGLTFINSTLLFWFFLFVSERLDSAFRQKRFWDGLSWLALVFFSFWNYPQVRLTASSASPDFVAGIYCCLAIYLFVKEKRTYADMLLVVACCLFAVTLKLTVAPVILLAVIALVSFIRKKKVALTIAVIFLGLFILTPFFARNVISSGYPAFPIAYPAFQSAEWKYGHEKTVLLNKYITHYARAGHETPANQLAENTGSWTFDWVPGWISNLSLSDKALFAAIICLLVFFLVGTIQGRIRTGRDMRYAILLTCLGLAAWFIAAPDPRFAIGFSIPLAALLIEPWKQRVKPPASHPKLLAYAILLISLVIASYDAYRVYKFFETSQLVSPMGARRSHLEKLRCGDMEMYRPPNDGFCADGPLPCIYESCDGIRPRGSELSDGFLPAPATP